MVQADLFRYNAFAGCLRSLDYSSLPGAESQLQMAPAIRPEDIPSQARGRQPVISSVLLLVYPDSRGRATAVFIQRATYDGVHSGQISLPGGRNETGDPSLLHTALRETHEEIGIEPEKVEVAGKLSDLYIPPSNHLVSPYIGLLDCRPGFVPDPREVEMVLEIGLAAFFDPGSIRRLPITLAGGQCLQTPCYSINGHIIWGATAMMVSEFVELIRRCCPTGSKGF